MIALVAATWALWVLAWAPNAGYYWAPVTEHTNLNDCRMLREQYRINTPNKVFECAALPHPPKAT